MTTLLLTAPALPRLGLSLLGMLNVPAETITVIGLIGGMIFAAIIVVTVLYFNHRKTEMWHETARIALEKGQPVPPLPKTDEELELTPPPGASLAEWETLRRARERRGGLKGGLILLAVGIGVFFMLGHDGGKAGLIPALIGVALIVSALIERLSAGGRRP